jgi:hypothetical protein
MKTFKVFISRTNPPAIQGVYDWSDTILATDAPSAASASYQKWLTSQPAGAVLPALTACYVKVDQI